MRVSLKVNYIQAIMIKISSISVLSFLLIIIPFSGFPLDYKNFIYITFGAIILILSLLIRRELHEVLRNLHQDVDIKSNTFSENNPQQEQK
jgi:flagellar biosynthesis component FlhA